MHDDYNRVNYIIYIIYKYCVLEIIILRTEHYTLRREGDSIYSSCMSIAIINSTLDTVPYSALPVSVSEF